MRIVRVDAQHPAAAAIEEAAAILRAGGLVAFPTETVYGLGANALSAAAVERIYRAKGRPAYNPIIVHIATADDARSVVAEWPPSATRLAAALWPGPLTLVLPRRPEVPDSVSAGLPPVAVRVRAHPVARALLVAAGIPIAAPSANRSTMLSPTTSTHVAKSHGDEVELILDAGASPVGIESTVVDLTTAVPTILRPGSISRTQLEAIIGRVDVASVARAEMAPSDAPRRSPGMLDRHYAPRARLMLVERSRVATRGIIDRLRQDGVVVGALTLEAQGDDAPTVVQMPADANAYAARLYDTLHALDDAGCGVIVVERVPDETAWDGVRDRLERGARE
jgi:L-threonylcarbamoyladenylate synthase